MYVGFYDGDDNKDFRYFSSNANETYFDISGCRFKWAGSPTADAFHIIECSKDGLVVDGQSRGSKTGSVS